MKNSHVGRLKPLTSTTGVPAAQASHERPLASPTKKSAWRSIAARSARGRSPVKSSAPCGMRFQKKPEPTVRSRSMHSTR